MKLKAALREKNITVADACTVIGIDPATFYRRMSRKGEKVFQMVK